MIDSTTRAYMYATYKHCGYCGVKVTPKTRQLDHVHPQCKGGVDDVSNLRMSCKRCNRLKGKTDVDLFIAKRIKAAETELATLKTLLAQNDK